MTHDLSPLIASVCLGSVIAAYMELSWIGSSLLCSGLCALFVLMGGR